MIVSSYHKELLGWICGVFITAAFVLFAVLPLLRYLDLGAEMKEDRSAKERVLHGTDPISDGVESTTRLTDKGGGSIAIEIHTSSNSVLGGPATASVPIELEASVEALADLTGQGPVHFTWHLPKGLSVNGGSLSGTLNTLKEGEKRTLQLTVQGQAEENQIIHLSVFRIINRESVGNVAHFQFKTTQESAARLPSSLLHSERAPAAQNKLMIQ